MAQSSCEAAESVPQRQGGKADQQVGQQLLEQLMRAPLAGT
ncbi:MAG: hypothetical protein ACKO8N_14120 [Rubrivivax sp.]